VAASTVRRGAITGRAGPSSPVLVALGVLIAVAAALRFGTLDGQSFWFDESVTVDLMRPRLWDVLGALPDSESTPALYYVLAWGWSKAFGVGEVGLRSLSALAGVATVPVAFAAGRRLASVRVGIVAAALVAANPMLVWFSQEARSYSLLVLLGALSFLQAVRARDRPVARELALWAACCALMVSTHYFGIFLAAAEAVWLLGAAPAARRRVAVASAAVGLVAAAWLPLALAQERDGRTSFIAAIPRKERIAEVARELATANTRVISSNSAFPRGIEGRLATVAVAAGLLLLFLRASGRERRAARVALAVGGGAILLPLAIGLVGADFFRDRNVIGAWVPLCVALACGLGAVRAGAVGLIAACAVCAAGVVVDVRVAREVPLQRTDWRGAARLLGRPDAGRAVVINPPYASSPLRHYGMRLSTMPAPGVELTEIDLVDSEGNAAKAIPAPPPGFQVALRHQTAQLRIVRYRAYRPRLVRAAFLEGAGFGPARGVWVDFGDAARRWVDGYASQLRAWRADLRSLAASGAVTATAPATRAARDLAGARAAAIGLGPAPAALPGRRALAGRLARAVAAAERLGRSALRRPRTSARRLSALALALHKWRDEMAAPGP
jgi:mannosyltransferase